MDINAVIIVGRLGRDPEVKYNGNGKAFARLGIATTRRWKDRESGQMQEATDWHDVVVSGTDAENAGKYLVKGQEVGVEGYLTKRKYQQNGEDRYATEVRATKLSYGSKPQGAGQGQGGGQQNAGDGNRPQGGGNNGAGRRSAPPQGGQGGGNNGGRRNAPQQGGQGGGTGGSDFNDWPDDIPF